MGACFGNKSKPTKPHKPHIHQTSSPLKQPILENQIKYTTITEKSEEFLKVTCKDPKFEIYVRYRHEVPIYDLKEQIGKLRPDIDISHYSIHKGKLEVLDPTATLKQLGILSSDRLRLKRVEEVEFPVVEVQNIRLQSSINYPSQASISIDAIKESEPSSANSANKSRSLADISEEDTSKVLIETKIDKEELKSLSSDNSKQKLKNKTAKELWRTAMPSPQAKQLIKFDPLEVSSTTNNTHDHSLKERHFPQTQVDFQIKQIGSVADSDESARGEKQQNKERSHKKRPTDLFKDLQGPFSLIREM